jgi:hypothetical protein
MFIEVGANMLSVIESKICKLQQEFSHKSSFDLFFNDFGTNSNLSIDWENNDVVVFTGDNLNSLKKLLKMVLK